MNKLLNGHSEECRVEIEAALQQDGHTKQQIRSRCIKDALGEGFSPDQVITMISASIHFENAYLVTVYLEDDDNVTRHHARIYGDGKMLQVCLIKNFAKQFLDESFTPEDLVDAIERLVRVAYRNNEDFHFQYGTHISKILKRAIVLAREEDLHSIDELVDFLEDKKDEVFRSIQQDVYSRIECSCEDEEDGEFDDTISFIEHRNKILESRHFEKDEIAELERYGIL